jgi:hypothetical protein
MLLINGDFTTDCHRFLFMVPKPLGAISGKSSLLLSWVVRWPDPMRA